MRNSLPAFAHRTWQLFLLNSFSMHLSALALFPFSACLSLLRLLHCAHPYPALLVQSSLGGYSNLHNKFKLLPPL